MRIALIRQNVHPYKGAEGYAFNFARFLIKKGHRIEIFARTATKQLPPKIILHLIKVPKHPSFLRIILFNKKVTSLLKKKKYDIIFSLERISYKDIYRTAEGCHCEWIRQLKRVLPTIIFVVKIYI